MPGTPGWELKLQEGGRVRVTHHQAADEVTLVIEPNDGPGVSIANGLVLTHEEAEVVARLLATGRP